MLKKINLTTKTNTNAINALMQHVYFVTR